MKGREKREIPEREEKKKKPPTNCIVRHDSSHAKIRSDSAGDLTRISLRVAVIKDSGMMDHGFCLRARMLTHRHAHKGNWWNTIPRRFQFRCRIFARKHCSRIDIPPTQHKRSSRCRLRDTLPGTMRRFAQKCDRNNKGNRCSEHENIARPNPLVHTVFDTSWRTMAQSSRGARVAGRSARSPPTKTNLAQYPAGSPDFRKRGIVPDDAVGRWVFSGISRFPHTFIPAPLHIDFNHPNRLLRAAQISSPNRRLPLSPSAKTIRVQSRAGPFQIFASGNRAARHRWSAGLPRDLPSTPLAPPFRRRSMLTPITLVGSREAPKSLHSPAIQSSCKIVPKHVRGQCLSRRIDLDVEACGRLNARRHADI
ncbi:hypothetical protein PR048_033232 [Dryococelus australis]|uniref:Uncharacterized protein n=1 Tax=Dryococelus australis TaxID=614101 RepID=A0ABQ9G101_9NEOP|nr:hypothetical protein PR048_033232 [Dryococelus australis]